VCALFGSGVVQEVHSIQHSVQTLQLIELTPGCPYAHSEAPVSAADMVLRTDLREWVVAPHKTSQRLTFVFTGRLEPDGQRQTVPGLTKSASSSRSSPTPAWASAMVLACLVRCLRARLGSTRSQPQ
jgi:hypothetical protein